MTLIVINILLLVIAYVLNDLYAVNFIDSSVENSGFPTEGDSCKTARDPWRKGLGGQIVRVIDGDTVKLQLHSIPPVFSRISETIGAKLAAEFAPLTVVGQRMCPSTVRIRISRVAESFFGRTAGQESQTYKK